jgi:AcrR family transcriptional regulator
MLTNANAIKTRPVLPAYATIDDPPSKRRILEAALHLFAERGLHAVTVRDIAKEAGYTNPAIFKFFDSKESLALFLFERCYIDLFQSLSARTQVNLPFADRLRALVEVFLEQLDEDANGILFVQDHLRELWPRTSKEARTRSIIGLIRHMLQDGVQQGTVVSTANLDLVTAAIVGTLAQFARLAYFGEFKKPAIQHSGELADILQKITAP